MKNSYVRLVESLSKSHPLFKILTEMAMVDKEQTASRETIGYSFGRLVATTRWSAHGSAVRVETGQLDSIFFPADFISNKPLNPRSSTSPACSQLNLHRRYSDF
jgi:hypothetical protein